MYRWCVCVGLILLGALGVVVSPAVGHGILLGASPPPNASLPAPPTAVIVTFSEAADPAFTSVVVVDREGRRVSGPSRLSADGRRAIAMLKPLPRGIYTVRWRLLSAVDGHTTTGTYVFTVRAETGPSGPSAGPPGSAEQGPDTVQTREVTPPPLQVVLRWISYTAALLLAGTAFYAYFIVRPALAVAEPHLAMSVEEIVSVGIRRLSIPAAVVLITSLLLGFVVQAQTLFDPALGDITAAGQLRALLTGTHLGWSVLLQAAMAGVLLIPATRRGRVVRMTAVMWAAVAGGVALITSSPGAGVTASQHFLHFAALLLIVTVYGLVSVMAAIILPLVPDLRLPQAKWAAPAAGAILLVGITLNSHAAGVGGLALGADWVHLAAAATWIGGLGGLLVTLRTAPADLRTGAAGVLVPRFSLFAGGSLVALVVTGTYAAWLNLPAWSAFTLTPYGRTLLIKLLLVVSWVGLGAFNHFVLRPRVARGVDRPLLRRFVRLIGGEVALAGAVLLAVAALTITPPSRVTMPASGEGGIVLAGIRGSIRVQLSAQPARAGWNTYAVTVERGGTPLQIDGQVQVKYTKLDEDVAPVALVLSRAGKGAYQGAGAELAIAGWWRADVILRQRGQSDLIVEFPMFIDGEGPAAPSAEASRILADALQRVRTVTSWREIEQITDGRGNVVATRFAFAAPDRLKYTTSSGGEAVVIGTTRYLREGGGWRIERLPAPVPIDGPYISYLRDPEQPVLGRRDLCGDETCRVVLWQIPAARARFAAWIGERSRLVHRLLMVAPQHYMTATAFDFDAPITIVPPK